MCEDPAFLLRTRHGIGVPHGTKLHYTQSFSEIELNRIIIIPSSNTQNILSINTKKLDISNAIISKESNIDKKSSINETIIKTTLNNNTNNNSLINDSTAKLKDQTKECFGRNSLKKAEKPILPKPRRNFSTFGRILKNTKSRALEANNKIHR